MVDAIKLKASDVLESMIRGLLKAKDDPKFKINMQTFGYFDTEEGVCFGCAATLALTEMFGGGKSAPDLIFKYLKELPGNQYGDEDSRKEVTPANFLVHSGVDIGRLEALIDLARWGYPSDLIEYCSDSCTTEWNSKWYLTSENWEGQLPNVRKAIVEMCEAGY